ncbi:S41 family peptidase [Maribacter sp.]|uniref:S41 family peptidase n=1 Tax=Maribacter sp. TaxID=1897614 RepID=UPI0025B9664F|nr:S41 family peptidase [Maribacter sp.]
MKKYFLLFLSVGLLFTSCNNDDDNFAPDEIVVQDFMWKAMNYWYFWQADVANLADDKFSNTGNDQAYLDFLASETDPGNFFDNKLSFSEDRFSFYSDDYTELTQALSGISKSNGLEFGLVAFSEGENIFGYVRYIIPNSDAATKDINRGELFTGVNGTTLTRTNYVDLLFGDADTYTLNMASINTNNEVEPNDKEVTLTKLEGLAENPVFLSKTFEINGEKIGYLVYNGFTNEYDEGLNNVFGDFKTAGVTNLVLDLRYNPGGSVNTARLLSSMIHGTNTTDVFLRQRWNNKLQSEFSENQLVDKFGDKTSNGAALNRLNLSKVYVLATNGSASSSELVMNGLAPYIDVVHIGEKTKGKNEFSITMVDDSGNNYIYSKARENKINTKNRWAIQPLVGRNENADGFSDYTTGLVPDIELEEDLANLGVLGEQNEPLLARAIQEITGVSGKRDFTVKMPAKVLTDSKMFSVLKDNMFLDKPLNIGSSMQ